MITVNQSPNGQIAYCATRRLYQIEFGNIFFNLSNDEMKNFRKYIDSIDYQHYLLVNKKAFNNRKLMLNVGSRKIYFSLHAHEFIELRHLLNINKTNELINNNNIINTSLIYN